MSLRTWTFLLRFAIACVTLAGGSVHAAYSCSLAITDTGVIYAPGVGNRIDSTGTLTITCNRDVLADANTLTYRIGADNGVNYSNPNRRVRLGATSNYLVYSLTRGAAVGGAATCADASNWGQIIITANVMSGTLNFGAAATASVNWGFCLRVRGNQGSPMAGTYTDAVNVYAQYPAVLAGAITPAAQLNYSIGASNVCVLNSFPTDMAFSYNSFQAAAQTRTQTIGVACSSGLPWTVAIAPAAGTLLGLNYTLTRLPVSGAGTGSVQNIVITGSMAAGQQGVCSTASCSASQAHTITISY
jgi:spore coat protein U-like protein